MGAWLYPISKRSGYRFEDRHGRGVPVSYETFRDLVVPGKIKDEDWGVHANFDKVRIDDELFIYTGDSNHGIIGYGRVIGMDSNSRCISFRLDRRKCEQLLVTRVPAPIVRRIVPFPRAPLIDLSRKISALRQVLPWGARRKAVVKSRLKELKLRPPRRTFANIEPGMRRVLLHHDSVLAAVDAHLVAQGFEVGTRSFGRLRADMIALKSQAVVIVEGKMIAAGKGRFEAREALGQLLEYSWWLHKEDRRKKHQLWVAFSARPGRSVRDFLRAHDVTVSWPSAGSLNISDVKT